MPTVVPLFALPAATAGAVSALLTWGLVRLDSYLHLTAAPRADRWHMKATPNSGGLGILAGCIVAYLLFADRYLGMVSVGAAAIWALGFLDDRIHLRPLHKLLGQFAISAAVVLAGVTRPLTPWPVLNMAIAIFWVVAITNAFNLIDNMDGVCAGVTIIIAGCQAVMLAARGYGHEAIPFAIVCGAFAGFLVFNYSPARIFMGDSGSMLAGFSLSALTFTSPLPHSRSVAAGVFYPAMMFAYPVFDTALVSILRRITGKPMSQGGRDHSSHRLVSIGMRERSVVWFLWGVTASGVIAGTFATWVPLYAVVAAAVLCAFTTILGIFLATLPTYPLELIPVVSRLRNRLPQITAVLTLLVDSCAAGLALFVANIARYDGQPAARFRQILVAVLVAIVCHAIVAVLNRKVLRIKWRHFSLLDIVPVICVAAMSVTLTYGVLRNLFNIVMPRVLALLFCGLTIGFIGGLRCGLRLLRESLVSSVPGVRRVAIFGTGDMAVTVLTLFKVTGFASGVPVIFLTDDEHAENTSIGGILVRSVKTDISSLCSRHRVSAILYPEGSAGEKTRYMLKCMCDEASLEFLSIDLRLQEAVSLPQAG
jgi:UDP-GlcNAc:undecaprenyl-phosphate/decaprenyl-phosphate GlcNAc-1-phosphate transferase